MKKKGPIRFQGNFRCSGCNKIRARSRGSYMPWDDSAKGHGRADVLICARCLGLMEKLRLSSVCHLATMHHLNTAGPVFMSRKGENK